MRVIVLAVLLGTLLPIVSEAQQGGTAAAQSFTVTVMGEVTRPRRYEFQSAATILDALALAGGFTRFADRSNINIFRSDGATVRRIPLKWLEEWGEDPWLHPGDIVVVP